MLKYIIGFFRRLTSRGDTGIRLKMPYKRLKKLDPTSTALQGLLDGFWEMRRSSIEPKRVVMNREMHRAVRRNIEFADLNTLEGYEELFCGNGVTIEVSDDLPNDKYRCYIC